MKLLIFFQLLIITIKICKPDDEPNTTIILQDSRTEMTVLQVNSPTRSKTNEFFNSFRESEEDGNDLDFDYDDDGELVKDMKESGDKEQEMQQVLLKAMRKPAIRKQIGEVIPILRVMSPAQRLTLAALVSSQIMSQNTFNESNLTDMASMFVGKELENADDRHNITEHLLLPISMDIAKMFKGLGKEMGRNLRQNLYKPHDSMGNSNKFGKFMRKIDNRTPAPTQNRRMDEFGDYESEEDTPSNIRPKAEALKQPGKDECDYFTKNLCLEVSDYPTEAIISSLRNNEDIAKTFLTDFEVQPNEERKGQKNQGRQLERRQDGQNDLKDLTPEGGYMCLSAVKYARPKRARTTSGQWKYIVNAGDYTQTLRLEICQKPKSPCSFITNHLSSQCEQIFNYHRLLTWDEGKGLHMDIFKVPSCCSCHIQGYSTFFPPNEDFTYAEKRKEPMETLKLEPERAERPNLNIVGLKREVSKPVPIGVPPTVPLRNPPHFQININEFTQKSPVDHLVPPGPPLPLENEGIFIPHLENKYKEKKGLIDHKRRYPVPTENSRIHHKATERIEINEPPPLELTPAKIRLKPPIQVQKSKISPLHHTVVVSTSSQEVNARLPEIHHVVVPQDPRGPPIHHVVPPIHQVVESNPRLTQLHHSISNNPQEPNLIYDASNQIHFLRPTPPSISFLHPKISRTKAEEGLFEISKSINEPQKINSPKPVQYIKPEIKDIKSLPSRVNPFFVTPPKEIEVRSTTTFAPSKKTESLTANGQKKINYNYHPIIDFFIADSKKRHAIYAKPPYFPASSQDWTPVVGP